MIFMKASFTLCFSMLKVLCKIKSAFACFIAPLYCFFFFFFVESTTPVIAGCNLSYVRSNYGEHF